MNPIERALAQADKIVEANAELEAASRTTTHPTMTRFNTINPTVERVAGRMARAMLREALIVNMELSSKSHVTDVDRAVCDRSLGEVKAMIKYVANLYGIPRQQVILLTRADIRGDDVEPI